LCVCLNHLISRCHLFSSVSTAATSCAF
jgi:hypothetical protein